MIRAARRGRTQRSREAIAGYLFVAIPLTLYAVYQFGALGYAFFISFWRWEILGPTAFVGPHNYQVLLADPAFHRARWSMTSGRRKISTTAYSPVVNSRLRMSIPVSGRGSPGQRSSAIISECSPGVR